MLNLTLTSILHSSKYRLSRYICRVQTCPIFRIGRRLMLLVHIGRFVGVHAPRWMVALSPWRHASQISSSFHWVMSDFFYLFFKTYLVFSLIPTRFTSSWAHFDGNKIVFIVSKRHESSCFCRGARSKSIRNFGPFLTDHCVQNYGWQPHNSQCVICW